MEQKKKLLLHICCCGCASLAIERLQQAGYEVTGFFFNPNIHPRIEYEKRKADLKILREIFSLEIIEAAYLPREWFAVSKQYAREKEGGTRCRLCYAFRLAETARHCRERDYDLFTTTLSISPHKSSPLIFSVGQKIDAKRFLAEDFKKKDGFKKSVEFSRQHGLYRQNYCGCIYSLLARRRNER